MKEVRSCQAKLPASGQRARRFYPSVSLSSLRLGSDHDTHFWISPKKIGCR
jgi:hypothetical protein